MVGLGSAEAAVAKTILFSDPGAVGEKCAQQIRTFGEKQAGGREAKMIHSGA